MNTQLVESPQTVEAVSKQNIDILTKEIKDIIQGEKIKKEDIVTILLSAMQIVQTFPNMKGREKKALVLHVLSTIINEQVEDADEAKLLKSIISFTLPSVIDTFIDLDKNKLKINDLKNKCKTFCCC